LPDAPASAAPSSVATSPSFAGDAVAAGAAEVRAARRCADTARAAAAAAVRAVAADRRLSAAAAETAVPPDRVEGAADWCAAPVSVAVCAAEVLATADAAAAAALTVPLCASATVLVAVVDDVLLSTSAAGAMSAAVVEHVLSSVVVVVEAVWHVVCCPVSAGTPESDSPRQRCLFEHEQANPAVSPVESPGPR